MTYIRHEEALTEGISLRVVQDEMGWGFEDYYGELYMNITYKSSSRYSLGTQAVTDEEYAHLLELAQEGSIIVLPVYAYVHSGASVSTTPFSCPWDSGRSGIVYIERDKAIATWGKKNLTKHVKDKAQEALQGMVKDFDAYLAGDIWGFEILDEDGEVIDSCWGYLGDSEYCLEEARAAGRLEAHDKRRQRIQAQLADRAEAREQQFWECRGVPTVNTNTLIW